VTRVLAIAAGATGKLIDVVAGKMVAEKVVRIDRAEEILKEIRD
jgi:hydroxymethylglutaryl-CoA reductase